MVIIQLNQWNNGIIIRVFFNIQYRTQAKCSYTLFCLCHVLYFKICNLRESQNSFFFSCSNFDSLKYPPTLNRPFSSTNWSSFHWVLSLGIDFFFTIWFPYHSFYTAQHGLWHLKLTDILLLIRHLGIAASLITKIIWMWGNFWRNKLYGLDKQ